MSRYSDQLIFRITAYCNAHGGKEPTREEAEAYLDSLGSLYRVMERSVSEGFRGLPSVLGGGERAKRAAPEPSVSSYT